MPSKDEYGMSRLSSIVTQDPFVILAPDVIASILGILTLPNKSSVEFAVWNEVVRAVMYIGA